MQGSGTPRVPVQSFVVGFGAVLNYTFDLDCTSSSSTDETLSSLISPSLRRRVLCDG